jgi:anti-sigma regulatory factor (Ser/Thr protein kinase)
MVASLLIDTLSEPLLDAVSVMVSELATNAVVHTGTSFALRVRFEEPRGVLRIEVRDHGGGVPHLQSPLPTDLHGRGLQLTAGLSNRWGVEPGSPGKTVWFELWC